MRPGRIPKSNARGKSEHLLQPLTLSQSALGFRTPGRVSATDLRRLVECPRACWYGAQEPFETAAPTLGLAVGEIVHVSRAELSRSAWRRYSDAHCPSDLWSPEIEAASRDLIAENFNRHSFIYAFGAPAAAARQAYTTLLLAMERQRAVRGGDLLLRQVTGVDLASQVLPFEVEVPVYDEERDLVGICDEVWRDGEFVVPVELKTSPPTREHLSANRAQSAAYGSLFTHASGVKVRECKVHYITQGIVDAFPFTPSLDKRVSRAVSNVRSMRAAPRPPKGRPSPPNCGYCSFQAICPESRAPSVAQAMDSLFPGDVAA
jgi:CRISPR-associated protein Cas4